MRNHSYETLTFCRFLLPASLIVINDIAAYICGFYFGRTPLIKLSPKKTWEGFIGASMVTMFSAVVVGSFFSPHSYATLSILNLKIIAQRIFCSDISNC
mgnify:CR=1 FL=1